MFREPPDPAPLICWVPVWPAPPHTLTVLSASTQDRPGLQSPSGGGQGRLWGPVTSQPGLRGHRRWTSSEHPRAGAQAAMAQLGVSPQCRCSAGSCSGTGPGCRGLGQHGTKSGGGEEVCVSELRPGGGRHCLQHCPAGSAWDRRQSWAGKCISHYNRTSLPAPSHPRTQPRTHLLTHPSTHPLPTCPATHPPSRWPHVPLSTVFSSFPHLLSAPVHEPVTSRTWLCVIFEHLSAGLFPARPPSSPAPPL